MAKTFTLAWRNMWRNWRRTAIALVAIVLGLMLLLIFDGMIKGSDQAIFGNAIRLYGGNLQVHTLGFRTRANRLPLIPLTNADAVIQVVAEQSTVVTVTKRISTGGIASNHGNSVPVVITAIDPTIEAPLSLQAENITQGRFLTADDQDAIVIGKGMADRLQVAVGDRVNVLGRRKNESMRQHTMTVIGIYNLNMPDVEKSMLFMRLADAQTLYNLRDQATEAVIFLQAVGTENALMNTLQVLLPNYEVDTWQSLRPEIRQALDTKLAFTSFIGLIVLFIASIGILNLMMMAVFERTREMGVLAALGMKGGQIMGLFLLEGALIGLVGAVIGCLLGTLLVWSIAQVGIDISSASGMGEVMALLGNRLYPSITLFDVISRGVLVIVIAALASLYPAWQAARKEPATALHHV